MKSNSSANPSDGIRLKVLLPFVLVFAVVLIAIIHSRSHSHTPSQPQHPAEEAVTTAISNIATAPAPHHSAPAHSSHQAQIENEPETARLISVMLDNSATLRVRRQSAQSLAKIGTDEAMAALKSALTNDNPPYVKAAIAEGLGQCPNPESADLLHQLVNGKDEITARGAARGLAARGDADAVNTLGNLLFNDQTPLSVRTETALALGDVNLSSAQDLLTRAVTQIQDEDVLESALDGLGRRPFSETQDFFRNYLNSPDVPAASKVLAIQSIADADGDDVLGFLSNYLNDANPDVRAAAKEALDFLNPDIPAPTASKAPARK
ncbi:MAG TPA: HEAT repeat domain-containing protein [Candidatus Polarisedimenticolia bacterium]|nr:HEAT repeat domain-containing protein [Candidatus Polarisedimenticolia bacterium]